jgi:hypothetical protein
MSFFRWIAERLKDLFYDPTNTRFDIGRGMGVAAFGYLIRATEVNIHNHVSLDLGPTGLPGGLATVLGAAAAYVIYDRKRAQ